MNHMYVWVCSSHSLHFKNKEQQVWSREAGEGESGSCSPLIFKAHISGWCSAVSWRAVLGVDLTSHHGTDARRWGGGWGARVATKLLPYSGHGWICGGREREQRLRGFKAGRGLGFLRRNELIAFSLYCCSFHEWPFSKEWLKQDTDEDSQSLIFATNSTLPLERIQRWNAWILDKF